MSGGLSESDRSWLIAVVSFCLMSLGRLEEAVGPRLVGMAREKKAGDWDNFGKSSAGLVDLYTPLGRWAEAETVAREAAEAAERIEDEDKRRARIMMAHSYLGRALHGQGRLAGAAEAFVNAELVQGERQPANPRLYSVPGFDYTQLLQEQARYGADWRESLERGQYGLAIELRRNHLLSIAMHHCSIGQALAALVEPGAEEALTQAVETMRRAGKSNHQPKMHLARAHYYREQSRPTAAWQDHAAASGIAQRGRMRTYLAECALLAGDLRLDSTPPDIPNAAKAWAEAELIVRETGYGRRLAELYLLQARLLHHQANPEAARRALDKAEARIREIGQWGFWPALHRVGRELGIEVPEQCPPAEDASR